MSLVLFSPAALANVVFWSGIPLLDARFIRANNYNTAIGNNDLYTVPAGRKAIVAGSPFYINDTGSACLVQATFKRGGPYYRSGSNTAIATGNAAHLPMTFFPIMIAGDIFAINDNIGGGGAVVGILEFSDTAPVHSAIITAVASVNTLLTVAAGRTVRVLPLVGEGSLSGSLSAVGHINSSGVTVTREVYFVPSGGSASVANMHTPTGGSAVTSGSQGVTSGLTVMAAGDFVQVNLSATGAQLLGMNYHERNA